MREASLLEESGARASDSSDRQLGFLWAAVALSLVALSPLAPSFAAGLWSCPFKSLTGRPCPSCGTGRAALALARFDPMHALVHYPLPALVWTAFIAGGLIAGWRAWNGQPLPRIRRVPVWIRVGAIVAVAANWAYSIATGV